jgi:biotin carboxyl carrier protein
MNYQVSTKKGEPVAVGLRESGEGVYEITIEGETVHVDAVKSGPTVYSMIEDGKQFEAMVDEKGAHGFDVLLGGRIFHLEAIDERTQLLAGSAHVVASGPQSIEAEMPGKVVMLSASVGDAVEEGHGVLVIEAMKMENEIRSPITGVIREISVSVGDTVESGTALFTVDPPAEN